LDASEQLVALAGDDIELVVGEFAPLLLDLAFQLLPVSFDNVPVHDELLVRVRNGWMCDARLGRGPATRSHRSACNPHARGRGADDRRTRRRTASIAHRGPETFGKDYRTPP